MGRFKIPQIIEIMDTELTYKTEFPRNKKYTKPEILNRNHIDYIIEGLDDIKIIHYGKDTNKNKLPKEILERRKDNILEQLRIQLKDIQLPRSTKDPQNKIVLDEIIKNIKYIYDISVISPSLAVGLAAAETISETLTQLALNTFHSAGSKHAVTDSITIVKSLITTAGSTKKNMKNFSMDIHFRNIRDINSPLILTEEDIFSFRGTSKEMKLKDFLVESYIIPRFRDFPYFIEKIEDGLNVEDEFYPLENIDQLNNIISMMVIHIESGNMFWDNVKKIKVDGEKVFKYMKIKKYKKNKIEHTLIFVEDKNNIKKYVDAINTHKKDVRNRLIGVDAEIYYDKFIQDYHKEYGNNYFQEEYWHLLQEKETESLFVLRLSLDKNELFQNRVSPTDIADKLNKMYPQINAIGSPINLPNGRHPIIDIFVVDSDPIPTLPYMNIFLNENKDFHIKGIKNIFDIFPNSARTLSVINEAELIHDENIFGIELDPENIYFYTKTSWKNVRDKNIPERYFTSYLEKIGFNYIKINHDDYEKQFYENTNYPKGYIIYIKKEKIQEKTISEYITFLETFDENEELKKMGKYIYASTVGSNLKDILTLSYVDKKSTTTSNMDEIMDLFGVEQARKVFVSSFMNISMMTGLNINPTHVLLIADLIFYTGRKYGAKFSDKNVSLDRESRVLRHIVTKSGPATLATESAFRVTQGATTPIGSLLSGRRIGIGTGSRRTLEDINRFKKTRRNEEFIRYLRDVDRKLTRNKFKKKTEYKFKPNMLEIIDIPKIFLHHDKMLKIKEPSSMFDSITNKLEIKNSNFVKSKEIINWADMISETESEIEDYDEPGDIFNVKKSKIIQSDELKILIYNTDNRLDMRLDNRIVEFNISLNEMDDFLDTLTGTIYTYTNIFN